MYIEIKGAGFINKGAELMLVAAFQKIKESFTDVRLVIAPKISDEDHYPAQAKLGLYSKIWLHRYGVQWGKWGHWVPPKIRRAYGLVADQEINVVLDASGFLYGDSWGEQATVVMAKYLKEWKKNGTKVILLPQAIGPFSTKKIRRHFRYIAEQADLIFPRDAVSYQHVTELTERRDNIMQMPDFTASVEGIITPEMEKFRGRFCIVPNRSMRHKMPANSADHYIEFCRKCTNCLIEKGHKPFILIHEGAKDIELARQIIKNVNDDVEIVIEEDVLKIKGIIGVSAGLIGSRYHALISALNQGVPVLATSWSHKYETLFEEYGMPDACLHLPIETDGLYKHLDKIINNESRRQIVSQLTKALTINKEKNEAMWQRIISVIKNPSL